MAQIDMFLKLDGIKGESQDHKHKDEIHIESFSWGMKPDRGPRRRRRRRSGQGLRPRHQHHQARRQGVAGPDAGLLQRQAHPGWPHHGPQGRREAARVPQDQADRHSHLRRPGSRPRRGDPLGKASPSTSASSTSSIWNRRPTVPASRAAKWAGTSRRTSRRNASVVPSIGFRKPRRSVRPRLSCRLRPGERIRKHERGTRARKYVVACLFSWFRPFVLS